MRQLAPFQMSDNSRQNQIDPIRFEVIRNALTQATEEMAAALRRSAYSTNVKTRQDFSCAYFDPEMRVIAQAFTQPVHLGSFVEHVPQAIRRQGVDNLGPGDMILSNDPYGGGVHLNDISLIGPVHWNGQLAGYTACLAHHVDVGGGAPASVGAFQEVFQEGVIIPAVKLVKGGQIVDDIFRLVLAQIRSKRETAGDFRAQVASNLTGARRVQEIVDRFGLDEFRRYVDEIVEYTSRRTRAEVAKLPKGVFRATGSVDNDGFTDKPVQLKVKVTIDDTGVHFDTTGSDPQRRAPVNSTFAQTFSACRLRTAGAHGQGPAGQPRFLSVRADQCALGHRHELCASGARCGRLGNTRQTQRHDFQGALRSHARRCPRRYEGDAVSLRFRWATTREPANTTATSKPWLAVTAPDLRRMGRTRFSLTARTRKTPRSKRWRLTTRCGSNDTD